MKTLVERKLHLEQTLRMVGEAVRDAWEAYSNKTGRLCVLPHLDSARNGLMAAVDILEDDIEEASTSERSVLPGDQ